MRQIGFEARLQHMEFLYEEHRGLMMGSISGVHSSPEP